jgi:hypothetical protein
VNSPELLVPHASSATDVLGADAIDQIVSRRRAELARLALTLRTATSRCQKAEAELGGQGPNGGVGAGPEDLLGVVDAMLTKAATGAAHALEQARLQAEQQVEQARDEAASTLRSAGVDPARVPLGSRRLLSSPTVGSPPTAAELWQHVGGPAVAPVRPAPTAPSTTPGAAPSVAPPPPPPVGASAAHVAPTFEAPSTTSTLLVEEAPVAQETDGQVFELFWEELPAERRSRSRFGRRTARGRA